MRRLAQTLTLVPLLVALAGASAVARPRPDAPAQETPPPDRELRTARRAPANPWSEADSARCDRLLDTFEAILETVGGHKDSAEDAKQAVISFLRRSNKTVADVIAEGKLLQARMQEAPEGFATYMNARVARMQRISSDVQTFTPAQNRALTELFLPPSSDPPAGARSRPPKRDERPAAPRR